MLSAPSQDSPERKRVVALLVRILRLLAWGSAVVGVATLALDWVENWQRAATFILAAVLLAAVPLVRAGHDRLISWLLPLLVASAATSSFINDDQETMFLGVFVIAMVVAGLVLDVRGSMIFSVACVLTVLGGAVAQHQGLLSFARPAASMGAHVVQALLLSTVGVLMLWSNRGVETMVSTLRDERARLRATNRELTHTQARHEALLEHSFGGIVVTDADMTITYCNGIAAELLQLTQARQEVPLDSLPGFEHVTFDTTPAGAAPEQLVHLAQGNATRPLGVRVGETMLADGQPGKLVLLQDLAELEALERDRGLLRAQVHQSQKMEALGRLAAGLAHDFNNILTVVIGNSDLLLLKGGLDRDAEESIEQIRDSSEKASDLTRQLLAFGRQSSRTMENVDIHDLLRHFHPMLISMVNATIDVQLQLSAEPVLVRVNPGELEQVLANLTINAADAMPHGGTIIVRVEGSGDAAVVAVSDTGEGMTEATQQRMFEPFFTTKGIGAGTGLGMAMVHGIVTTSGGELHVESSLGQGTTIEMRFPLVHGPPTWSAGSKESRMLTSLTGVSVLVVDDEPSVRDAIGRMLEEAGARVTAESNGGAALQHVEGGARFDVLILDVVMPGMSGPALARQLRELGVMVPIVFVSGHVPPAEKSSILESSPHFLTKPVSPTLLSRTVAEALAGATRA